MKDTTSNMHREYTTVGGIMSAAKKIIQFPKEKKKKGLHTSGLIRKHFRYTDAYGVSRSKYVYGATTKEAEKKKQMFLADVAAALRVDEAGRTVSSWVDEWLEVYKKPTVSIRTFETYDKDCRIIKEHIGTRPIRSITSADLQAIVNSRKKLSASAIKKTAMTIRAVFKSAAENRLIPFAPPVNTINGTSGTHRALTKDEIIRITAAAHALDIKTRERHPFAAAAMLMLYAGLRRGEAVAYEFGGDDIHVTKSVTWPSNQPVIKSPKSKASIRHIPVMPPLRPFLSDLRRINPKGRVVSETVFNRLHASFKALCGVSFRCHDLRHTFATMLYDAGVDVKTAQAWLGHDDAAVTMRIYTHLSNERKAASVHLAEEHFNQFAGGIFGGMEEP